MQHTALPGAGATRRTRDGGYLFGRELLLFHLDRMRLHAAANLSHFGQSLNFVAWTAIPGESGAWSRRLDYLMLNALVVVDLLFPTLGKFRPRWGGGIQVCLVAECLVAAEDIRGG